MKIQIVVFKWNHTIKQSIYADFDDMSKLVAYLNELTRDTDDTYLIYNGDNSRVRTKGGENNG